MEAAPHQAEEVLGCVRNESEHQWGELWLEAAGMN
jgi:hypothetical protein